MNDYTAVLCIIRAVTAKAYRIETGVGVYHWIPRAACKSEGREWSVGDTPRLLIKRSFLERKGIAA